MLLFQRLSHTHELTALRTAGLTIREIATPILFAGGVLTVLNFVICNEIAPRSKGISKNLIFEMAASNPLFLLQKESLIKLKNAYVDVKSLQAGNRAEDVVIVLKNSSSNQLGVLSAKELTLENKLLRGKQVAFISSADLKREDGFNHLIIENPKEMDTEASSLSQFVSDFSWTSAYDYLPLRRILAKEAVIRHQDGMPKSVARSAQVEIARRVSLSLAALAFRIIGVACGMEIGRTRSKKGVIYAIALAAGYMVCFIMAKSMRHSPALTMFFYFIPYPIILLISLRFLHAIREGRE